MGAASLLFSFCMPRRLATHRWAGIHLQSCVWPGRLAFSAIRVASPACLVPAPPVRPLPWRLRRGVVHWHAAPLTHQYPRTRPAGRGGAHWEGGAAAALCRLHDARRRLRARSGGPAPRPRPRLGRLHHRAGQRARQHAQDLALPAPRLSASPLAADRAGRRVWAGRLGVKGGGGGGAIPPACPPPPPSLSPNPLTHITMRVC